MRLLAFWEFFISPRCACNFNFFVLLLQFSIYYDFASSASSSLIKRKIEKNGDNCNPSFPPEVCFLTTCPSDKTGCMRRNQSLRDFWYARDCLDIMSILNIYPPWCYKRWWATKWVALAATKISCYIQITNVNVILVILNPSIGWRKNNVSSIPNGVSAWKYFVQTPILCQVV